MRPENVCRPLRGLRCWVVGAGHLCFLCCLYDEDGPLYGVVDMAVHKWGALDGVVWCFLSAMGAKGGSQWFV